MRTLRFAGLVAGALAVTGVAACTSTVTPGSSARSPQPAAAETGAGVPASDPSVVSPRSAEESRPAVLALDLTDIVLGPEEAPSGTGHDRTVEGTPVLTRPVVSGRDSEFLALDGFAGGRYAEFSGESGIFMSLGLLFDTVENAERAFDRYLDELLSDEGYGVGAGGVEGELGEEGTCAEFDNPSFGDLHENACLWRHGNLVLIAGGTLAPDVVHALAAGMDTRALSALAP